MLLSSQPQIHLAPRKTTDGITLRCPQCFELMGSLPTAHVPTLGCSACGTQLPMEHGIWKALLPERTSHYARFVEDYQSIRAAEGRGSSSANYYLALPYRDLSGRLVSQWAIRARTFQHIERGILPRLAALRHKPLRVLDLGAGNGWMSYRLAMQGYSPVAVDLLTNDNDGLGAARHYQQALIRPFPCFQAEADNLPFADSQFDVAIFNASFHYSENYEKTLGEALRCVRNWGTVIIADTPWYSDEHSGRRMLEERRAQFISRYGFASDQLNSLEYLTDKRLGALEQRFHIRWQTHRPNYGIRWRLRPVLARLRRARKPSRFRIYTAMVAQ
jgi:ubiquinone/menaquinone biosynthesis C-methylase UbiE